MRDKYIATKNIQSRTIIFKHPEIPIGTICETTYHNGRYVITYGKYIICCVGSEMEKTYFKIKGVEIR